LYKNIFIKKKILEFDLIRLSLSLTRNFADLEMATATYPPPPPYYRLYKDYLQNPKSAPDPPPPIEGTYLCFGANYTVCITIHASSN